MVHAETQAIGWNQCHGFTPAVDLLDDFYVNGYNQHTAVSVALQSKVINILVAGAADVRHVMKTIAFSRRWLSSDTQLNFYVVEDNFECIARQFLLLAVMIDRPLSVEVRMQYFLEFFANSLIREKSQEYLQEKANEVIRAITDSEGELAKWLDLTHLKFKERDLLEEACKFWIKGEFAIESLREHRMRGYFADRYDARANLMDWDYTMRIKKVAPILHYVHYREWRQTGLAFQERFAKYTLPNKTLASEHEMKHKTRGSVMVRGYWSDILISPYISFGVEASEASLFEIRQEQQVKNSMHVSEFNVKALIVEWETGKKHQLTEEERRNDMPKKEEEKAVLEEVKEEADEKKEEEEKQVAEAKPAVPSLPRIKLHILPSDLLGRVASKEKYKSLFDRVILGPSTVHLALPALNQSLKENCIVTLETMKFAPLKDEQHAAYLSKLDELATACHWTKVKEVYKTKDDMNSTNKVMPNARSYKFNSKEEPTAS